MENEDQFIRSLLANNRKTAPSGFTETLMRQVRVMEERRSRRRLILAIVFKTMLFTGLFVFLVVTLLAKGIRIDGALRPLEDAGQSIVGFVKNAYFIFPLLVLLAGRKLFAIK